MRTATENRVTTESRLTGTLTLEGSGAATIDLPIPMLAHLLAAMVRHGGFNLELAGGGDVDVDQHHLVEDTGYFLGRLFHRALGDRQGIRRSGWFVCPMDEALSAAGVDLGGRPWVIFEGNLRRRFCGSLDTDLLPEFFAGFSRGIEGNIVIQLLRGDNDHHRIEAAFKALGRALEDACRRWGTGVPSTKGRLDGCTP